VKSLARLLFSFDGRIRRSDYWLALCIFIVVTPAVTYVVAGYLRGDVKRPLVLVAIELIFAVRTLVIVLKRFNDLEWPRWLALATVAACTAVDIADLALGGLTTDGGIARNTLFATGLVMFLAQLFPCGFLRGKPMSAVNAAAAD
jgi:uncharacterized membrane protein YhaH (DUF805 family)